VEEVLKPYKETITESENMIEKYEKEIFLYKNDIDVENLKTKMIMKKELNNGIIIKKKKEKINELNYIIQLKDIDIASKNDIMTKNEKIYKGENKLIELLFVYTIILILFEYV
jgi:hypothetical protein